MGLGGFPVVTLDQARDLALEAKRLVKSGADPIEARRAEVQRRGRSAALRAVAEELIAAWSSPTGERAWRASLAAYAYPTLGAKDCASISVADVVAVLRPLWGSKRPTAERVRSRIEMTLDRAKALGLREGDNPAALKILRHVLPPDSKKAQTKHHAALPYAELPDFMRQLAEIEGPTARALEFCIHTAARTNEILGAYWREIDLERRLWTVPAHRMKTGAEHKIPLSGAVVDLLRGMERGADDDLIFRNGRARLGVHSMRRLAQEIAPVSVHGFRSSFRDWAGDKTEHPREVIEAALAHTIGNAAERAYRRESALGKRRLLMSAWSAFCAGGGAALTLVEAA